jgi:hypothetical protein
MDLLPDFTASEVIDVDVPTFSRLPLKSAMYSKAKPFDARAFQKENMSVVTSGRLASGFPDEAPVFAAIPRKLRTQPPAIPIVHSKPVERSPEQQENVPKPADEAAETVARLRSTVSKLKAALEVSERTRIEAEARNDKLRLAFAEQEREIERLRGCLEARAASSRHSMCLLIHFIRSISI